LNRVKVKEEIKEIVDIDFYKIRTSLPTTELGNDKHKRELFYAELDTTLEGNLDVVELIEGLIKHFEIEGTKCNNRVVKAIVIICIFKTLEQLDEF